MSIAQLQLQGIRNLKSVRLAPHSRCNLITGANASGKSSLLEAIHFLGLGRSFRTSQAAKVVQRGSAQFVAFALINDVPVGIQWQRSDGFKVKVRGEVANSLSILPSLLPLQLITPETVTLLTGGPKERRAFIDWGVFHVEPQFHQLWRRYRRLLRQRNAALRRQLSRSQISIWDTEYAQCSAEITQLRHRYIENLRPQLTTFAEQFIPELNFKFEFYQGWESDAELAELLQQHLERDLALGYTQYGPHKADLKIKTDGVLAAFHLSRGQQKLLVCALRLAQGIHLQQQSTGSDCVFLIDDFSSELDSNRQALLADVLKNSGVQLFITGISSDDLMLFQQDDYKVFHVEQGEITERLRGAYG